MAIKVPFEIYRLGSLAMRRYFPNTRYCLSDSYSQVLSLCSLQPGAVSLVATARYCLSVRYSQVLSLWSLQPGAVSLFATARCCLSGRYSQTLSLYMQKVALYFIPAQTQTHKHKHNHTTPAALPVPNCGSCSQSILQLQT
jgi:hypothetical protein